MASREDQIARATGGKTPPAARPMRQGPPLRAGVVYQGRTDAEKQVLTALDWPPNEPLPENAARILHELQQSQQRALAEVADDALPPPIDINTPPIKIPEPRPFENLSAEEKLRIRNALKRGVVAERAVAEQKAEQEKMSSIPEDLRIAMQIANEGSLAIEDDSVVVPQQAGEPKSTPKAAAAPTETIELPKDAETGVAAPVLTHCPHCSFDLGMKAPPEPAYGEKMAFLHALLGEKCFEKTYALLGGNLTVTFRTLLTAELEVMYKQAHRDRSTQRILVESDYWERLNRYRLFLQLRSMTGADGQMVHLLPKGLSKETNPDAETFWETDLTAEPNETILRGVEDHIVGKILKNESVFRIVNNACNEFNRLVAKLEAMVDNSDFWLRTEEQS